MAGASSLDPERTCGRCRVELGRVINRGAYCRACRLKVCKACREYSLRTTDWVCTVCHKHMEIQAASGEWMNEFVRRPSRRRDNRVYVPAADLIKRTIRRSWTISNPSPRFNAPRNSVEIRPYSSLPHGQELSNYPALAVRRTSAMAIAPAANDGTRTLPIIQVHAQPPLVPLPSPNLLEPPDRRPSTTRRSHSEDVYSERIVAEPSDVKISPLPPAGLTPENPLPSMQIPPAKTPSPNADTARPVRINPLIKYASERKKEPKNKQNAGGSSSSLSGGEQQVNKGCRSPDGRRTQSCRVREVSPGERGTGIMVQVKKKPLSVVAMSGVTVLTSSSRSESEDEEVQNYMLGNSGAVGRGSRRKPMLQHAQTVQSCDLGMGRTGNSAFRTLDAGGPVAGARRMSEKRVSFDQNVETSSSESTPTSRPFTKSYRKPEDFLRSTKRRLPNNTSSSTTLSETPHQQQSSPSTIGLRKPSLLSTTTSTHCNEGDTSNGAGGAVDMQAPEAETPPELCDIEPISGTVFRKVTVRRRRQDMRKMAAVDNGWRSKPGLGDTSDPLDSSSVDGEDYKLVFISSDSSSSKDEDQEDNDSSSTASSFPVDECDWDYFEPGSNAKPLPNCSPFGSPKVRRRSATVSESSPIGSPLVYRKGLHNRESDPGTDEDSARYFDSGSSDISLGAAAGIYNMADDWLQCAHNAKPKTSGPASITAAAACQNCGANPQYVPVPVPVPIPVPVPAMWNARECLARYAPDAVEQALRSQLRVLPRGLWPFINQAALIWPLISAAAAAASTPADQSSNNSPLWALLKTCTMHEESAAQGSERIKGTTGGPTAATAGASGNTIASSSVSERIATPVTTASSSTDRCQDTCTPLNSLTGAADECAKEQQPERNWDDMELHGYLLSESKYDSSTESSSSSAEDDAPPCCSKTKRQLSGSYDVNVSGESDEALDVSEMEEPEAEEDEGSMSKMSMREEESDASSSGSADTDTDDTGTVADRKPKRFTRVFIVNKSAYSSSDDTVTSNSDDDTSDNDTDVERDCGIILTCIKPLSDNECIKQSDDDGSNSSESEPVILLKRTEINNEFSDSNRKPVDLKDILDQPRDKRRTSEKSTIEIANDIVVCVTNDLEETSLLKDAIDVQGKIINCASSPCFSEVSAESLNSSDAELVRDPSNTSAGDNSPCNGAIITNAGTANTHTHGTTTAVGERNAGGLWNREVSEAKIRSAATQSNSGADYSRDNSDGDDHSSSTPIEGEPQVVERDNRAGAPVSADGEPECVGAGAGSAATHNNNISSCVSTRHAATRYTSLVMITQGAAPAPYGSSQVSVVTTDTTTLVPGTDVVVQHTNEHDITLADVDRCSAASATLAAINSKTMVRPSTPVSSIVEQPENSKERENVIVITGADTLSAVVCLEEGLADDDSWVENLSHDDDDDEPTSPEDTSSSEEVTLYCTAASDREDDLRGYHRAAIDFTLHTIVEESCEESEVESLGHEPANRKQRPTSATDLEKYFCYGLSDNMVNAINANREDAMSETSSVCSEGIDSYVGEEGTSNETNELATSRLEKYFLHGFMGFTAERRDSDGSVGSDSEGRPSPEQRRKRLVRARGTGRSHSSSLDNLITNSDLSGAEPEGQGSEHSSSSETDTYDESNNFDKSDGQFDTVKRKKCKKQKNGSNSPAEEIKTLETTQELNEEEYQSDEDGCKTPQLEHQYATDFSGSRSKHQSRDSGFIGSCDDLIKEDKDSNNAEHSSGSKSEFKTDLSHIEEEKRFDDRLPTQSTPPATSLTRKDSFNNWSSDEETNLMMCKMRQFFKTMVANNHNQSSPASPKISPKSSNPTTPKLGISSGSPKPVPSPRLKTRSKPPQLVYFENELTRLMKTVPGIREDQVREIVEYLSSEDTWSDSYDSSDYTSSDLEGAVCGGKSVLQQQISDSCKQIINKFETVDNEGDEGDGGIMDESHGFNRETAFVYQKLVASFEKMATGDNGSNEVTTENSSSQSPPLIAKVMHHIGSRLVALMHEVSSGESHASNSPKTRHYHRRLQQKLSNASSTTTEDDDSPADTLAEKLASLGDNMSYNVLPRSKSHDLLMGENKVNQANPADGTEERETSDCERFSWRGSFESALLATDSRNKLSLLGGEGSASASALAIAAKRRSAGDLLFSHKSPSREQLDRVRSCGSIGGANSEDKLWVASSIMRPGARRRSSVPDASCGSGGSADGEEDEDEDQLEARSTLPRSLTSTTAGTTNSLPRLPTNGLAASPVATAATSGSSGIFTKTQSVYHFLQNTNSSTSSAGCVSGKSARYRAPGYNSRLVSTGTVPKRAVSAPGLQPTHHRRGRRSQQPVVPNDDVSLLSEAHSSPMLAAGRTSKSSTPSPVPPAGSRLGGSASASLGGGGSSSGGDSPANWTTHLGGSTEEDIDRLVAIHHQRTSLSSLGLRSDSMASVYSGAGDGRYGTVTVRGQVEFGLQYNYKAGALEILVKQCKDLAAVDAKRNRSDPYVKVYLLPDKSKGGKRKTKVRKHTLSPVFDECLRFHISLNGLETRTLWLTVFHSDMFGRNDFLGEVMMSLENKVFDDPTPMWYNLQERTEPFDEILSYKGDILVGLKFVPPDMTVHKKGKRSRGALHVLVKEAKCLTAIKANGLSDPFCKSYLLPDKGRGGKQKTAVIRRTVNPVWNHTFVYNDVTLQELADRCLELTVWDHDRLASNEFLGGVRFSLGTGKTYGKPVDWMDATGKEMSLWKSMLERPNFWVEGCLSLRPTLDHRSS